MQTTLKHWATFLLLFFTLPMLVEADAEETASGFSDKMPYPSKFIEVNDVKMHYVEGGKLDGPVFVFIHGNPSSSYLWRNVMPHLASIGRVIAFDLVGFGKSGKPVSDYTFQSHSVFVNGFIKAMELKDIVLVIHDWGSALGLEYARTHPKNVKGIAMMEAIIPPTFPMKDISGMGGAASLFKNLRDPEINRKLVIEQNVFIEGVLNQGAITRTLSEVEKDAYRAPFLDKKTREPILIWPNELPIAGKPARNVIAIKKIGKWLKRSRIPKLLLYADPGVIVSPTDAMWMQKNYRNLQAVFIGPGRHYVQEDQPHRIGRNIFSWYLREVKSRG